MASTYKPIDAFTQSKALIKMMPLEAVGTFILDNALKMIWMAAPWRWTLGDLPAVTIAASTVSYTIVDPADFLYIQQGTAYISAGDSDVGRDVEVVSHIHTTVKKVGGGATQVCHPAAHTVRISPKPGATVTTSTQLLALYRRPVRT